MRFMYTPGTGVLNLYVKQKEFDLAAKDDEYRVMTRDFSKTDIGTLIEELTKFSRDMLNVMTPEEKLQDLIAISMIDGGYTWTSLIKLQNTSEPQNFLNMLLDYGVSTLQKQSKNSKSFMNDLSEQDRAKLQLVTALLNYMNYDEPWKRKTKKKESHDGAILKKLKTVGRKISAMEKKYGFDTEQMLKYYRNDSLPDVDFAKWISLHDERMMLNGILSKKQILSQILDLWMKVED